MPRRIDGRVEQRIVEWAHATTWTPAQMRRELSKEFEAEATPHVKTIQRIVREERARDRSGPWTLASAEPGDARLILEALAAELEPAVQHEYKSFKTSFTNKEAEWLLRVRSAASEMSAGNALAVAREYLKREGDVADSTDLDVFLAFAPQLCTLGGPEGYDLRKHYLRFHLRTWPTRQFVQGQLLVLLVQLDNINVLMTPPGVADARVPELLKTLNQGRYWARGSPFGDTDEGFERWQAAETARLLRAAERRKD